MWNALRTGDKVLVHNPIDPVIALQPGTVAMVDTVRGTNDIGVRVVPEGQVARVVRPLRMTVHLDPRDPTEACWRCNERVADEERRRGVVGAGAS